MKRWNAQKVHTPSRSMIVLATTSEESFNMKHFSARSSIERCFGLLELLQRIHMKMEETEKGKYEQIFYVIWSIEKVPWKPTCKVEIPYFLAHWGRSILVK